jgi:hypothetical protein
VQRVLLALDGRLQATPVLVGGARGERQEPSLADVHARRQVEEADAAGEMGVEPADRGDAAQPHHHDGGRRGTQPPPELGLEALGSLELDPRRVGVVEAAPSRREGGRRRPLVHEGALADRVGLLHGPATLLA